MSEYWVSKKKYYCKYCEIYIADDAPSRQHHENGMRHKGNLERFIRGIYKSGEKQKKDKEEEAREMKRVEQAAAAAFAGDVSSGLAKASSGPTPVASRSAPKPIAKSSNPYANYSTAESLGYTDPDAERLAAELEARRTQGVAGQWETVEMTPQPIATDQEEEAIGFKRAADGPPPEEDMRSYKLQKKTLQGLGDVYDPDAIPIKIKKREPPPEEPAPSSSTTGPSSEPLALTSMPKFTAIQLKKPEDGPTNAGGSTMSSGASKWAKPQWSEPLPDLKLEERKTIFGEQQDNDSALPDEVQDMKSEVKLEPDVKIEDSATEPLPPSGGALFKKRRAPANAGRGRRDV
ncbi:hypothetical protein CPB83DRAFT_399937 [Crepidotus variabilis]|uniref:Matrin-type domain-containing protein n=1 Tax=Crepidotus variabilis TaxID=179855 RepID=A0A9P6JNM5_9AGAR|nr:hypothetical protein CPB83DRAFT_399937 [Crepidotus variabilis]